jgi:hypothetical protein
MLLLYRMLLHLARPGTGGYSKRTSLRDVGARSIAKHTRQRSIVRTSHQKRLYRTRFAVIVQTSQRTLFTHLQVRDASKRVTRFPDDVTTNVDVSSQLVNTATAGLLVNDSKKQDKKKFTSTQKKQRKNLFWILYAVKSKRIHRARLQSQQTGRGHPCTTTPAGERHHCLHI